MNKLTVKTKMFLLASLAAVSLVALAGINLFSLSYQGSLEETATLVDHAAVQMLTLRKHEKDFLARDDEKYVQRFEEGAALMEETLKELNAALAAKGVETANLEEASRLTAEYRTQFAALVAMKQKVGLTDDQGLRGKFRAAAHQAEAVLEEQNSDSLLADALTLRRREKDFLLRLDWKYVDAFNKDYQVLLAGIERDPSLDGAARAKVGGFFDQYHKAFLAMAEAYQEMGLNEEEGLRGALRDSIHQTEAKLTETEGQVDAAVQAKMETLEVVVIALSVLLVVGIMLMILYLTRGILRMVSDLLEELNQATEQVHSASGDISSSAQQLSSGATEQAAGLEEVTSTMEQISSQSNANSNGAAQAAQLISNLTEVVRESAEGAGQAAQLAQATLASASGGVESMGSVNEAMREITAGAEQITGIIQVINEITHQTKMLATNAAIEAARAGEQGKGFAVVADEVSKLAENSKTAAKEIGQLIKESVEKSQNGAKLAEEGALSLNDILEKAKEVSGLVENIAEQSKAQADQVEKARQVMEGIERASGEQSQGVSEVTTSLSEIDKVTQSNAANAEQSAASAEQLNAQARALQEMVEKMGRQFGVITQSVHRKQRESSEHPDEGNHLQGRVVHFASRATPKKPESPPADDEPGRLVKPSKAIPMRADFADF